MEKMLYVNNEADRNYIGDAKYAHVRLHVVEVDDEKVRNVGREFDCKPTAFFNDLQVSCQIGGGCNSGEPYAFAIDYHNPYTVTLDVAKKMAATLGLIHKRMERMADEFGSTTDFSEYAVRVAKALGVKKFVFPLGSTEARSGYDDRRHAFVAIGEARGWIRDLVGKLKEKISG